MRALIVDDEPAARARLQRLLEAEAVEIVGECVDGDEALDAIARLAPDVVFLDVEMPGRDGFGVLGALTADALPAIVFVTAFDSYALRAFEVHAVDYLLKPVSAPRLAAALAEVRARLARDGEPTASHRLRALTDTLRRDGRISGERLVVRTRGRLLFLRTADIDWVEAAANYVRLHVRGETHIVRESMRGMEERLPPDAFLRIHRSTIVNLDRVKELQPWFHGEYVAILRDGTRLTVSRAYLDRLHAIVG